MMNNPFRTVGRTLLFLTFLSAQQSNAFAWGSFGHEVIAQIAYDKLTPHARNAVDLIIKLDPSHRTLWESSIWPDEIRHDSTYPDSEKHPARHFVDVPIVEGALSPPGTRKTLYSESETVTYGVRYYAQQLEAANQSPQNRADDLSWLIHLVGDIHQPLHCATLVTPEYPAPAGDRGGNMEYVTAPNVGRNGQVAVRREKLHAYWDYAPELLLPSENPVELATQLEKIHPPAAYFDSTSAQAHDADNWADESATLALFAFTATDGSTLTDSYVKRSESIVSDRLAHAGYRLAALLNHIFQ